LSGLAVAALILLIGFELAKESVTKIFNPEPVEFTLVTVLVLVGSILVKLWMASFNIGLGRHIQSQTLLAAGTDSRNDVISTAAVLAAGLVECFSGWKVDGFMGLAVALFIMYSGTMLAKDTISPLLGENVSPELRKMIIDTVQSDERVLGYHDLMVHDYGPGQRFASLHVEMDQREDPMLCHDIIDNLERACYEKHNVHLVIHYDPVVMDDQELAQMRTLVSQLLTQQDSRLSLHDFRMVRSKGHTNLIFDVALPFDMRGKEKQLKKGLEKALDQTNQGKFYTVITFDPEAFNKE
jgi:cation diffusion facilitator family transporter